MTTVKDATKLLDALNDARRDVFLGIYPHVQQWVDILVRNGTLSQEQGEHEYFYHGYTKKDGVIYRSENWFSEDGNAMLGKTIEVPFDFIENPEPYFASLHKREEETARWKKRQQDAAMKRRREALLAELADLDKALED